MEAWWSRGGHRFAARAAIKKGAICTLDLIDNGLDHDCTFYQAARKSHHARLEAEESPLDQGRMAGDQSSATVSSMTAPDGVNVAINRDLCGRGLRLLILEVHPAISR